MPMRVPPGSAVSADELEELEEIVQDELPAYLEDLATLVNVDCGSYTKAGVDQVGTWTAGFLERLGAQVEIHANSVLGNTVVGTFTGQDQYWIGPVKVGGGMLVSALICLPSR